MNTRDVIERYLESVRSRRGWEAFLSDEVELTNYTEPVRRTVGKEACLPGIRRFYAMMTALEVKGLIVEGNKACALTRYALRDPDGRAFASSIAEVFEVDGGEITSFGIYFDSAPYPAPRNRAD